MTRIQILKANGISMTFSKDNQKRIFTKGENMLQIARNSPFVPVERLEKVFGTMLHREKW